MEIRRLNHTTLTQEFKKRSITMTYVMHICRNKKCNNGWIDKDLTRCTTFPPSWKYCKECAEKLGIDFDSQTPDSNLSKRFKYVLIFSSINIPNVKLLKLIPIILNYLKSILRGYRNITFITKNKLV